MMFYDIAVIIDCCIFISGTIYRSFAYVPVCLILVNAAQKYWYVIDVAIPSTISFIDDATLIFVIDSVF